MTPLERIRLHADLLLLPDGSTGDQYWAAAGVFTRAAAWTLRADYLLIRKFGGRVCEGLDCDKLMSRTAPHRIFDVVRSAGANGQEPIWDDTGHLGHLVDGVEPVDPGGTGPLPEPPVVVPAPVPEPVQPYPDEEEWWEGVFDAEVARRYAAKGQAFPNPRSARWSNRTAYDIRDGMTKEASMAKHLAELDIELGG